MISLCLSERISFRIALMRLVSSNLVEVMISRAVERAKSAFSGIIFA